MHNSHSLSEKPPETVERLGSERYFGNEHYNVSAHVQRVFYQLCEYGSFSAARNAEKQSRSRLFLGYHLGYALKSRLLVMVQGYF